MTTKAKRDKSGWTEIRRLRKESAELRQELRVHLNERVRAGQLVTQASKQVSGLTTLLQKSRDDLQYHILENQRLNGYIDRLREVEAAARGENAAFKMIEVDPVADLRMKVANGDSAKAGGILKALDTPGLEVLKEAVTGRHYGYGNTSSSLWTRDDIRDSDEGDEIDDDD